jgi:hypothetical protein
MTKLRRKSDIRSNMDDQIFALRQTEHLRPARPKRIPKWQPLFLAGLSKGMNVRGAARHAGISFSNIYAVRAQNAEFADAWDKAIAVYERSKFWFIRPVANPYCTCKVHKPSSYFPTTAERHKIPVQR